MKTYELTYIITPEITSEEAQACGKEIESAIQSREGTILKQSNPIAKTLAFPIAKRASGFFGVLEFQIEPEKLLELKEVVTKDGKIVRHMVIIKEPVRIRKERRPRKPDKSSEEHFDGPAQISPKASFGGETEKKEKIELKDIEQKIDELLGE